jgi:ABC-2 type transport system ATP-binding protein
VNAVEVTDLIKRYPKSRGNAVDGLSFTVERGEVFGMLGPNGAGKTTTVGILTTRVRATGGRACVAGLDVMSEAVAVRTRLAVVPQQVNLDRSLSVRNNLVFHAAYHGVDRAERGRRADALLERMGLGDKAGARIDTLSGGQSQRAMIARALMHRPEVLFLDEPSTGLDPQARLFVHDQIAALRDEGVTVVLTTHDMDEAAKLSDRVAIVDHGKLLTLDTPAGLIRSLPGSGTVELTVVPDGREPERIVEDLDDLPGVERVELLTSTPPPSELPPGTQAMAAQVGGSVAAPPDPGRTEEGVRLRLYVDTEPASLLGPVAGALTAGGTALTDVSLGEPTLEDVFISLTGRELR